MRCRRRAPFCCPPPKRPATIFFVNLLDARRCAPRITVDGLCGVVANDDLRPATMTNLSTLGVRLERPFDPKTAKPIVQLEIELPGVDEVLWASANVTHAYLTPMAGLGADGQPRFWCRAGLRIADACSRERRLLRDYVVETLLAQRRVADRRGLIGARDRRRGAA
jgi:hypothetical protein